MTDEVRRRLQAEESLGIWAVVGRAVALWLDEFCDRELPYPQMVREASVRAMREIDALRQRISELEAYIDRLEAGRCEAKEG